MNNLDRFQTIIDYKFKNLKLIKSALTHSSAKTDEFDCYEKLEFLGDSLLSLIVSEQIFYKYQNEGDLSKIRAKIVCEENLYLASKKIELDQYIILGKSFKGAKPTKAIVADVMEAIIAAIYLDCGDIKIVEKFVNNVVSFDNNIEDYKTLLQEVVQQNREIVKYDTYEDDNCMFLSKVSISGVYYGKGSGKSKKISEQMAARQAYLKIVK